MTINCRLSIKCQQQQQTGHAIVSNAGQSSLQNLSLGHMTTLSHKNSWRLLINQQTSFSPGVSTESSTRLEQSLTFSCCFRKPLCASTKTFGCRLCWCSFSYYCISCTSAAVVRCHSYPLWGSAKLIGLERGQKEWMLFSCQWIEGDYQR